MPYKRRGDTEIKLSQLTLLTILAISIAFPVHAKSRHEMCEIAKIVIETISKNLGDSSEVTAKKRLTVHNQCFTAPLAEIEETYSFLIENWDTIFDQTASK